MKIQYISDIHTICAPIKKVGDVLVFAGDCNIEFAKSHCDNFDAVIYVPGNHEYYGRDINDQLSFSEDNFYFLDNDSIILGDTEFFGSTLWSHVPPHLELFIINSINDYQCITKNGKLLKVKDTNALHVIATYEIKEFLAQRNTNKRVIITHHLPSYSLISSEYQGSTLNSAFASGIAHDLSELPDLWLFGHSHSSFITAIDNCIFASNTLGYRNEKTNYIEGQCIIL